MGCSDEGGEVEGAGRPLSFDEELIRCPACVRRLSHQRMGQGDTSWGEGGRP